MLPNVTPSNLAERFHPPMHPDAKLFANWLRQAREIELTA
jgi:hypothetical protein